MIFFLITKLNLIFFNNQRMKIKKKGWWGERGMMRREESVFFKKKMRCYTPQWLVIEVCGTSMTCVIEELHTLMTGHWGGRGHVNETVQLNAGHWGVCHLNDLTDAANVGALLHNRNNAGARRRVWGLFGSPSLFPYI